MSIGTGTKLGPYEVQDFIGQGAMGLVYRAYHAQLARTGAVKVMQAIAPDSDSIARFRREAQAIAQMRHPNILNVFDFGEHEGMPYMIVEYVPGGSLANRLSQGKVDQAAALRYLRGIAAGLDHAHGLGIIHRDVKPANVLLERDDTPVLADFGLAKLLQSSSVKSMTGVTTGTPAYMSPEQVTGGQVGPPADRYSLATIAYEMLTGSIPFDGEGLMEVLYAQVHREPPLPSARNSALSPQVDAVVMRGLAKDPAARWESCTAFVDALAAALAVKSGPAVARTVVMPPPVASTMPQAARAAAPTVAMPYPAPAEPVVQRKSRKRRNAAIVAGVLVVLLILGALLVVANRPTLSLSASTVTAGDTVVVNASHLPANQNGEIQLLSIVHTFPFHANANGDVSVPILVPKNIGSGDHTVKLCWGSSCRASATLHVIEPVSFVTPSPEGTPSTAPGASPTPGATPSHSPSPGPSPKPTSSPTSAPVISISNYNVKIHTGTETVYGLHFSPGSTVAMAFVQGTATTPEGDATVSSSGYFSKTFTVPSSAVLGPAAIKVCGTNGCLSATVNVTAT